MVVFNSRMAFRWRRHGCITVWFYSFVRYVTHFPHLEVDSMVDQPLDGCFDHAIMSSLVVLVRDKDPGTW